MLSSSLSLFVFSTYQYRVKTTYITTFFFFLLLCFPEHCFCCLCLLFYPILYSFLFYSLLACVVILSHCVSFFSLSFCLNVERIVKLNLFQPILKKRQGKGWICQKNLKTQSIPSYFENKAGQGPILSKESYNSIYSIPFQKFQSVSKKGRAQAHFVKRI